MGPRVALQAVVALLACVSCLPAQDERPPEWERRAAMVDLIAQAGVRDSATLAAMRAVPRHRFVPADARAEAYGDFPLPIGHGQTISQPYIVAFMTEQLRPRPGLRVLEIGTGSGYQAAVLAEIGCEVYSIEIVEPLARRASALLDSLGYAVQVRAGDGYGGWPDKAPFDAVIVTAAADEIPPALLEELGPGGRLIMPVGPHGGLQYLVLVERDAAGTLGERVLLPVRFVPLIKGEDR